MFGWLRRLFGGGPGGPGRAAAEESPLARLSRQVTGPDRVAAEEAARQLGELRHPEAVGPLLLALKFGAHPVRLAAVRALEQIGREGEEQLRAALSDPYPYVRNEARRILAQLGEADLPPTEPTG
jgi:HEAT repeat protein